MSDLKPGTAMNNLCAGPIESTVWNLIINGVIKHIFCIGVIANYLPNYNMYQYLISHGYAAGVLSIL